MTYNECMIEIEKNRARMHEKQPTSELAKARLAGAYPVNNTAKAKLIESCKEGRLSRIRQRIMEWKKTHIHAPRWWQEKTPEQKQEFKHGTIAITCGIAGKILTWAAIVLAAFVAALISLARKS